MSEKTLQRERGNPWAEIALAQADLGLGNAAEAKERMNALLARPVLAAPVRAFALSVAADADNRVGDTRSAFAGYVASKEELRRHHAPEFAGPGVTSYYDLVERTIQYFQAASSDAWKARETDTSAAAGHVFLLGFPRSGTTLLQQALAAHPAIATTEEMNPFPGAINAFFLAADGWARLAALDEAGLAPYRETYWRIVRAVAPSLEGRIFLDKNPLRTTFLPIVSRLFPRAKVLFAVRDPRDVVLSCLRQQFAMSLPMYEFCTLDGCARLYDAVMRLAVLYREKLDLDLMEIRHETLAAGFEPTMRTVCAFLEIAWNDGMHDIAGATRARLVTTPSGQQLTGGLSAAEARWRRYKNELAPVMPLLLPWVRQFGYPED